MASPFDQAPLYGYKSNSNIRDLMLMGGETRARAAEQAGQNWARAIGGIGQAVAGGIQQYGEQKQEQKKQQEMAKRDSAAVDFVSSWDGKDPTHLFTGLARIGGPEYAKKYTETALALHSKPTEDAKSELQGMYVTLNSMRGMPPPMQAATWKGIQGRYAKTATEKLGFPAEMLAGDWTPDHMAVVDSVADSLGGVLNIKRDAAPKTPEQIFAEHKAMAEGNAAGTPAKVEKEEKSLAEKAAEAFVLSRAHAQGSLSVKPPAEPKAPGKPLTQGEVKGVTEIDTGIADAAKLKADLSVPGSTGAGSQLGAMVPNFITEATGIGAHSKKQQAVINRVKQVIGKALEGGVLRKEDEEKYKQILPTIGDPPEVAQAKIDGLISMLEEKRGITLDNLESTGRDVSRLQARGKAAAPVAAGGPPTVTTDAEYAALPPGAFYKTPEGKLKQKKGGS